MLSEEKKDLQEPSGPLKVETELALQKLLNGNENVNAESNSLKMQLEKLLVVYEARESQFTATVKDIKEQYASILKEATDKAKGILDAAQKTCEANEKISAKTLSASRNAAAENVKTATEKSQKLVTDATAQAAAILAAAQKEREAWDAEKALVADIQKFKPVVKVNVGGTKFTTSLTTLCRFPDTMIGAMYSGRHELVQDEEGYHFIDRDGTHFRYILNFLRSPETFECELTGAALKELKSECAYYGLKKLMFPFKPLPAFKTQNADGKSVTVSQDQSGIFKVKEAVVRICMHCGIGDYGKLSSKKEHYSYDYEYYIDGFLKLIRDREGVVYATQPIVPAPCPVCDR